MAEGKPTTKEERAREREETNAILNSFKMDLDSTFTKIINKKAGIDDSGSNAPSGFHDPNAARKQRMAQSGQLRQPEDHHMDWDAVLAKLGHKPAKRTTASKGPASKNPYYAPVQNTISIALHNRASEEFQPVMNELSRFKFASAPDKREQQLKAIYSGVKKAMQTVAIQEVANTTQQFYKNAVKFSQTDDGLKVVYAVGQVHVQITANGTFCGDEIVCCEQDGTNVTGYVARQVGDDYEDLTGDFEMKFDVL